MSARALLRAWGKVATVPLPGIRGEDNARTTAILKSIRRQEGWRDDRTPAGSARAPASLTEGGEWQAERMARTPAGSILVGTPHLGSDKESDRRFAAMVSIPRALAAALAALEAGKPVAVIVEGREFDSETADPAHNEGDLLTSLVKTAAERMRRSVIETQTWDDLPVNVMIPNSPVWDRLSQATQGSVHRAQAAIAIRFLGLGLSVKQLQEVGLLNEASQAFVESLIEQELPEEVLPVSLYNLFYRTTFPHEFDAEPNEVSAISDLYDAMRQANILRKIHEAERKGAVAVVLCSARHAYNLKPVIEGKVKKTAALPKEILTGLSPAVASKAKSLKPKMVRADQTRGVWTYEVPSSGDGKYTVKVKVTPRKRKDVSGASMDVQVSCDCEFFRWQGPMHWASVGSYLLGKPAGESSTPPKVKDPTGQNKVCKHAAAVLLRADNWFLK